MTERTILERNKAVLWARDVISRPGDCYVLTPGESAGEVSVATLEGAQVAQCNLQSTDGEAVASFSQQLKGKDVVAIGVTEAAVQALRKQGLMVHDLVSYYALYLNPLDPPKSIEIQPGNLLDWVNESLTKMAGSSLVLDQADTGAGKWTSAHFKPSASMMEKFKSLIKP